MCKDNDMYEMNDRQRQVHQKFESGQSVTEIANDLGVSTQVARNSLNKARKKIARCNSDAGLLGLPSTTRNRMSGLGFSTKEDVRSALISGALSYEKFGYGNKAHENVCAWLVIKHYKLLSKEQIARRISDLELHGYTVIKNKDAE